MYRITKYFTENQKFKKYYFSALINFTIILMMILTDFISIILKLTGAQAPARTLCELFWLYPITLLLFVPKVSYYTAIHVKCDVFMYMCSP